MKKFIQFLIILISLFIGIFIKDKLSALTYDGDGEFIYGRNYLFRPAKIVKFNNIEFTKKQDLTFSLANLPQSPSPYWIRFQVLSKDELTKKHRKNWGECQLVLRNGENVILSDRESMSNWQNGMTGGGDGNTLNFFYFDISDFKCPDNSEKLQLNISFSGSSSGEEIFGDITIRTGI